MPIVIMVIKTARKRRNSVVVTAITLQPAFALLQHQSEPEPAVCLFKLADGAVFPAEGRDGLHPQAVARALGHRQALLVEGHRFAAGVDQLQHDAGGAHHLTLELPPLRRQLQVSVDGVFQGVGQYDGQLPLIHRQLAGQGESK